MNPKPNMVRHRTTMPCPRSVTQTGAHQGPQAPPTPQPRAEPQTIQEGGGTQAGSTRLITRGRKGRWTPPSQALEQSRGLPVTAHSPGHKQQAVACVIQPEEANLPACLGMMAGGRGKGPSGQRQVCQQGHKSCSPPFPALKAKGTSSPDLGVWSQLDARTEAHGG